MTLPLTIKIIECTYQSGNSCICSWSWRSPWGGCTGLPLGHCSPPGRRMWSSCKLSPLGSADGTPPRSRRDPTAGSGEQDCPHRPGCSDIKKNSTIDIYQPVYVQCSLKVLSREMDPVEIRLIRQIFINPFITFSSSTGLCYVQTLFSLNCL